MKNPSQFEQEYVHKVYQKIASDFSRSRRKVWDKVSDFLNSLPQTGNFIEVGAGNGNNLHYLLKIRPKMIITAVEPCPNLAQFINKQITTVLADNLKLPFQNNSFDFVLSVAVIHHFSTLERRKQAINELFRILKPSGKMLIEVWKSLDTSKDVFVPWKNEKRYYHLFERNELEKLFINLNCQILQSFEDRQNWGIIISKNLSN